MLINELPQKIQDLLKDPKIFNGLESIGKKYTLHIDQIGEMSAVTDMLLTGQISSKDFTPQLKERLEMDGDIVEKIAQDINEQVLKPIRFEILEASNEEHKDLNAEQILNEIENPTKISSHINTVIEQKVAQNVAPKPLVESMGVNLIEQKLTKVVEAPKPIVEKISANPVIPKNTQSVPPSPKGVDAYREPIE